MWDGATLIRLASVQRREAFMFKQSVSVVLHMQQGIGATTSTRYIPESMRSVIPRRMRDNTVRMLGVLILGWHRHSMSSKC